MPKKPRPTKVLSPKMLLSTIIAVLLLLPLRSTYATTISVDQFTITKNGAPFFDDTFSDGVPPPSAPNFANGTAASYNVVGTVTETGGRALMSPVGAVIVPGAGLFAGHLEFFDSATLLTNIDPSNLALGLKSNSSFSMTGLFDLTAPGPLVLYGIRFHDLAGDGDDIARMQVGPGSIVAFTVQVGAVVTALASLPLNTSHDQIALTLTKGDPSTNAITGSVSHPVSWTLVGDIAV